MINPKNPMVLLVGPGETINTGNVSQLFDGWEVVESDSPETARKQLDTFDKDYIGVVINLLDHPDWDQKIAGLKRSNVRLVAVTADLVIGEAAVREGVDDYLLYPLRPAEINARLLGPCRLAALAGERYQLILSLARGASIGRLTSHFCHEINNAMQAARGALTLALEEPGLSSEMNDYLRLCDSETHRIVDLVHKLRQLYRPEVYQPSSFQINSLLQETLVLTKDSLSGNAVIIEHHQGSPLPPVHANYDLIQLAILSLLLDMGAALSNVGGGTLKIELKGWDGGTRLDLVAQRHDEQKKFDQEAGGEKNKRTPSGDQYSLAGEILTGEVARMEVGREGLSVSVIFPIAEIDGSREK